MDPNDDLQRGRLFKSAKASWTSLEPFRKLVLRLVEEYVGPGYSGKSGSENLINLMSQAVGAYTMSLAANRPRVLVNTPRREYRFFARHFQEAVNNLIKEIGLEHTIRDAVLDAFFCIGIVKIHMADSAPVQLEGDLWMDPGQPFASTVALENWCHDMSAPSFSQIKFAADSYRVAFDDLKEDRTGIYEQKVVKELHPTSKHYAEDRLENVSKGLETDHDEFEPMIDLMDFWIPADQKIYTFAMDSKSETERFTSQHPPVAVMDWEGSEHGPYRILSFADVPEAVMPLSPASHLSGLGRLVNNLMKKQSAAAEGQKDVYIYTPAGAKDAKNIQRTPSRDWVQVESKDDVDVMKIGGVDSEGQAFMLGSIQMFDRMAGNLSAKMGLGPQAETVGQEKLIHGAVSSQEAYMQDRTIDFARGVVHDLGDLLWRDQVKVIPGEIAVEGASQYATDATWTPDRREGVFEDYDLDIDIFSMPYQSPAQRVESLNQLLTGVYIPLGEMLMSQGGNVNLQELTEIYAELLNLPRLKDVIQFSAPPMDAGQGGGGGPKNTTREYIRKSVPTGGTMQGRQHVEQQAWLNSAKGGMPQAG